ncbi:MAG TPA: flagellar export chaperone FliS [Mycobacteriales bacterium]|nr:fliS [Cryptosporangiaceae bacterium]MDQ1677953.1 flagellar secretion chaperone FliS [Actinomycetota bacterium]HEV7755507.1 flagellar export chaperone FliS [Mycobacteriales bacterium]
MSTAALRARYMADAVTTASPARLLVMLYDKLLLDLGQAEDALGAGDRERAAERLLHAQEIVLELLSSLDLDAWDGAKGLAALYTFLAGELVKANVRGDVAKIVECRALVVPLRDAWQTAAEEVAQAPVGGAAAGGVA